ncbi:MAG: hypothetical protein ACFB0Z_02615 [Candidatus Phaeomarinobacter sp.]
MTTLSTRLFIMVEMAYGTKDLREIEEPSVVEWFWAYGAITLLPAMGLGGWLAISFGLSALSFIVLAVLVWLVGIGLMHLLPAGIVTWTTCASKFLCLSAVVAVFWGVALTGGSFWAVRHFLDIDPLDVVSTDALVTSAATVGLIVVAIFWVVLYRRACRVRPEDFFITADATPRDDNS